MGRKRTHKVYVLKAENSENVYIGSTSLSLQARLRLHRGVNCTTTATQLLQFGKLSIELLELVQTREQSKRRELYHINTFRENGRNVVNKYKPIRV